MRDKKLCCKTSTYLMFIAYGRNGAVSRWLLTSMSKFYLNMRPLCWYLFDDCLSIGILSGFLRMIAHDNYRCFRRHRPLTHSESVDFEQGRVFQQICCYKKVSWLSKTLTRLKLCLSTSGAFWQWEFRISVDPSADLHPARMPKMLLHVLDISSLFKYHLLGGDSYSTWWLKLPSVLNNHRSTHGLL